MPSCTFSHSQVVRCPIADAPKRLADHFRVDTIVEPLRLDSAVDNRVRLTLDPKAQLGDQDLLFDAHWTPIPGAAVPTFHGEFLVRPFGRREMLLVIGGRIEPSNLKGTRRSVSAADRLEAVACARFLLDGMRSAAETPRPCLS